MLATPLGCATPERLAITASRLKREEALVFVLQFRDMFQNAFARMSRSRFLRKYIGRPYILTNMWIWKHLPASVGSWRPVRAYGAHLHSLIQLRAARIQSVGTFFFRNSS